MDFSNETFTKIARTVGYNGSLTDVASTVYILSCVKRSALFPLLCIHEFQFKDFD